MLTYKDIETTVLMELLMQKTILYTNKLAERESSDTDLIMHEYEISLIQGELNSRKIISENTTISDPTIKMV